MAKIIYNTVKIPMGLTKLIDKLIDESEGMFTSRTDLIKQAVRDYKTKLEEYDEKHEIRRDGLASSEERIIEPIKASNNDAGNGSVVSGESTERIGSDLGQDGNVSGSETHSTDTFDGSNSGNTETRTDDEKYHGVGSLFDN